MKQMINIKIIDIIIYCIILLFLVMTLNVIVLKKEYSSYKDEYSRIVKFQDQNLGLGCRQKIDGKITCK